MKRMRVLAFLLGACVAGNVCADCEIVADQLEFINPSFPKEKLRRYLAANDSMAHFPGVRGFFHRGIGMPAPGSVDIDLGGGAKTFCAEYTLDNESRGQSAVFRVLGDGRELWRSPVRKFGEDKAAMSVSVEGIRTLTLAVEPAGGCVACTHACWGEIRVVVPDGFMLPGDIRKTSRQLGILTPPPARSPRINGARVYGVRPGHPVLFRIPVTGARPLKVGLEGLEKAPGLEFDEKRGVLKGSIARKGTYVLCVRAENEFGCDQKPLTIKVGDQIALTPPMGWNSWNAFGPDVSAEKVAASAQALIDSGLADHGWTYVNIDDFWSNNPKRSAEDPSLKGPDRTEDGEIVPNRRFPDMKALVDGVHKLGLKVGLYSSPGPLTCGGCIGSYLHEEQDARTYARWGFDYLKYDWCTGKLVGDRVDGYMLPFLLMGRALKEQPRDIVYSFNCGTGKREPSLWGPHVSANCWRISGDLFDTWTSISTVISMSKRIYRYSAPGGYNDPDMLCVGPVRYNDYRPSRLSNNEQYTHVSMWALFAAPLMIGCDLARMDAFTLSLLTNDEVIEIDQDELGQAAACIDEGEDWEVWARPLADGSLAVGLFNKSSSQTTVSFDMEKAGVLCKWRIRDCWRQEDIGIFSCCYSAEVPGHATHLVRLFPLPCGRLRDAGGDIRDAAWKGFLDRRRGGVPAVSAHKELFAGFAEPPQEAKPWTYWFWTNSLTDRETMSEELADIAKLGFGGILLTDSRGYWDDEDHVCNPPATIRWGSEEWLDLIAHGVREAAKLGLKLTINIAASGGHLRGDADVGSDSPKFLKCRSYRPGVSFERPDIPNYRDVAVFAVRTDEPIPDEGWRDAGDGFFSMEGNVGKRLDGNVSRVRAALEVRELGSAAEGSALGQDWTILRFGVGTIPGREMDIDVLDRTAVNRHLNRVFARLLERVSGLVGADRTFAGLYNVSWEGLMPTWSETFESDFRRIAGYDLHPLLPTLAGLELPGKPRTDILRDFRYGRGVMMREHLYETVCEWAHRHGMIAYSESGGPWGNGSNKRNPCTFGECDQYAFLGSNDFPQGEFWPLRENGRSLDGRHANRNGRYIAKAIASTAHIYDRQIASVEAFTHMHRHWSVDPAFLKALGDQAFADGINRMVWHTYTASPRKYGTPGLEYFAGSHINRNVTWHDDFPAMVKYLSRCQYLLQRGTPVTDIAVLVGDRAYAGWGTEKNGRFRNLVSDDMPVRIPRGFCYDAVNDDALVHNPQLLSRYRIVYDARPSEARGGTVDTKGLLPDVETESEYTWCHRRIDGTDAYFLAGEGKAVLTFRVQAEVVEIWDAVTGRRTAADARRIADGRTRIALELPVGGSCFVMFLEKGAIGRGIGEAGKGKDMDRSMSLDGPWEVSFAYPHGISAQPPKSVRLEKLVDFTDRDDLKHFSGTATYRTTFTVPSSSVPRSAFLSLGDVPSGLAHAYVNGVDCGTIWCEPWEADVSAALRPGRNELEIRYTNNWSNRLIGDCGLPEEQRVTRSVLRYWTVPRTAKDPRHPENLTPTVYSGYAAGDSLQSSGLLGPVKILMD